MPLIGEYEPSTWPDARAQVELFERSRGTEGNTLMGLPVVIITTTGKSTGKLRKTPLMRVEHEGRYLAVASMGGAPSHPSWYHNMTASPLVELQDGAERRDYTARELDGPERDTWWARAVEAFPNYADYQGATTRRIPVMLLEPLSQRRRHHTALDAHVTLGEDCACNCAGAPCRRH